MKQIRMLEDYSYGPVSDVKKLVAGNVIDCPDEAKADRMIAEGFAEEYKE